MLSEQIPMKVGHWQIPMKVNKLRYDSHFQLGRLRMVLMEAV